MNEEKNRNLNIKSVRLSYTHNSWETKMYPCIGLFLQHWVLLDASARIFVRNAMYSRLVIGIDSNIRLIYFTIEKGKKEVNLNWIQKGLLKTLNRNRGTYAQVSVRTNWRDCSTWFTIYIQLPTKKKQQNNVIERMLIESQR